MESNITIELDIMNVSIPLFRTVYEQTNRVKSLLFIW